MTRRRAAPKPRWKPSKASREALAEMGRRGAAASLKAAWLDNPTRPQPSLPRVRWLERPDPLEDRS